MQAVRGFSQIAAQKQQLGFLQKQQAERHAEGTAGAKHDQPEQPQLAQPAAATHIPSGVPQGTATGQLLPNSCKETCKATPEADAGTAVRCQLQRTAVNSPPAPSSSMAADSHLQLPQREGQSQQLAGSYVKSTEQSMSAQPSRPVLNDGYMQQPVRTCDAEHDTRVQQGSLRSTSRLAEPSSQSRSLAVSRTLKRRAAPQSDGNACKQTGESSKSAEVLQSVSQLAQGQYGRTMPANTHGATARATKRAKQASGNDDADRPVRAVAQHRASKAPAGTLPGAARPAGKAHAAGKASPAAAVVRQPRAGSSAEARQFQQEPVSCRSLRPRQARTTAVVDSSSEHDSDNNFFVDESSDVDSAAELRAGASRHDGVNKAGMKACKVACASTRQISASAGRKTKRQQVSSTDEDEDTALPETAVCDSEADDGGTDEVLGESSEEELARPSKTARLPAKNGFRKRTGGQQAKQAAAGPRKGGRAGAVGTGRGGYRRTATRQNFVRSNLKASCITHAAKYTVPCMDMRQDYQLSEALIRPPIHPSVLPSVCPSIFESIHSSIHPSIHSLYAHRFLMGTYTPLRVVIRPIGPWKNTTFPVYIVFCPRKHRHNLAVMKTSMQTDEVWFSSRLTSGMQGGKGKKFLSKSGARGRTKKGSTKFGRRKTRSATAVVMCTSVLALPCHW